MSSRGRIIRSECDCRRDRTAKYNLPLLEQASPLLARWQPPVIASHVPADEKDE